MPAFPNYSTSLRNVTGDHEFIGWTKQPDGRGTFDIIWSSTTTIFLCAWSVLCLNVPAREDSLRWRMTRKTLLACLAILGPEFVMGVSVVQLLTVRRRRREFHKCGYKDWTEEHGFYAEMGGFLLKTADDFPAFPVDSAQVLYLLEHGFLDFPEIEQEDIKDKNKVDVLLRLITVAQTLYFLINLCARAAKGYAITCLEITAVGMLPCTLVTYYMMRHKPMDVEWATVLHSQHTITAIVLSADAYLSSKGLRERGTGLMYNHTPLDFVSRQECDISRLWSHYTNVCRAAGFTFMTDEVHPSRRIRHAKLGTELTGPPYWATAAVSLVYVCIQLIPWNFEFPTPRERTAWRAASILYPSSFIVWTLWGKYGERLFPPPLKDGIPTRCYDAHPRHKIRGKWRARLWRWYKAAENNTVLKDPSLSINPCFVLPTYLLAASYFGARATMLVLDVIELRALPASALKTVDWLSFLPHFGT